MTNDKKRSEILEKISKLAELSNPEHGGFEGEIANAAAAMQRLMDKYSISIEEVAAIGNAVIDEAFEGAKADMVFGKLKKWNWMLARIIARITHTKHYSCGHRKDDGKTLYGDKLRWGKTIAFYGRDTNANLAASLFVEWSAKLSLLASEATSTYCKELLAEMNLKEKEMSGKFGGEAIVHKSAFRIRNLWNKHPNVFRASWLSGCLNQMLQSVYEQEQSRTPETANGVTIYDEKIAAEWNKFSEKFGSTTVSTRLMGNSTGRDRGEATGANLHIGQKEIE